jgi:hypothetical protein
MELQQGRGSGLGSTGDLAGARRSATRSSSRVIRLPQSGAKPKTFETFVREGQGELLAKSA